MKKNQNIGQVAEDFAYRYLHHHGLTLVERNYASRFGEIDLIMRQQALLIFIEVRLRNNPHWPSGKESVDYFKTVALPRY